jgi:hypothetical protein
MNDAKRIVHIRKVDVGGEGSPRRSTYEVFYPAGKGRKHAEDVRRVIEAVIRALCDSDQSPQGQNAKRSDGDSHASAVPSGNRPENPVFGEPLND